MGVAVDRVNHVPAVLVDRLPNRVGLEDPPLVEMRVETPNTYPRRSSLCNSMEYF